ncbi:hypothetical protein GCM10028833_02830 [Glycomyces tarimensis]
MPVSPVSVVVKSTTEPLRLGGSLRLSLHAASAGSGAAAKLVDSIRRLMDMSLRTWP